MTSDPWDYRCRRCGAGLMPTVRDPAPEYCDEVCAADQVLREARTAHRRNAFLQWLRERYAWFIR